MAFDGVKSLFKGAANGLQRLKFNAWTLGRHGAEIFEKSAEALQLERLNPLRGVDEWRLGQIFDDARDGIYADLAWLYNEIEGVEPALVACCDMRESAASECGWLVRTADAAKTRGFDEKLADDQRDALLEEFGAVDDDLAELAGHLVSAFFRGAAHALPLWNEDGSLAGFRKLDLWNFAFDRNTGIWYWNADASRDEGTFQPVPPGVLVSLAVSSSRHVDHAALPIFIRAALGAKRYGVWLDRFGIPPVAVIMPPNAEKGEQQGYMDLARKFARGGNGILPNGSAVSYGTEARATCPFPDFIRFQQEQIYMIGIGRVQSGANDAANLGGNAAGVVEAGFTRLVRRDARLIARAINDAVTAKVLARRFPGKPVLAQFAWDTEAKRTSREVLEDAGLARNAGLAIDIGQVSQMTGYKLEKDSSSSSEFENGGKFRSPTPTRPSNFSLNSKTPLQTREEPLQIARKNPDGRGEGSPEDALVEALSGLFEKTLTEAAAEGLEKEDGEVRNSTDAQGNEHDDGNGQFTEKGGSGNPAKKQAADKAGSSGDSGSSGKPAEAATVSVGSINADSPEEQNRQVAKAAAAFEKCLSEQVDVPAAFHRSDLGDIDLRWGKTNKGLRHMIERRDAFAKAHPGAPDGKAVLAKMPETIVKGKVTQVSQSKGHPYIAIEHGGYRAIITRDREGGNHWFISGYDISNEGRGYRAERK